MKKLHKHTGGYRRLYVPWIAALLCLLPGLARGASGSFTHTVTFDSSLLEESEVISPSGEAYTVLSWEGLGNTGELGEPELPSGQYRFLIPTYCNNLTVEVIANTSAGMRLCRHKLLPVQEPQTTGNDPVPPFTSPLKAAYAVSTTSPKAEVVNEFFLAGDRHIVDVSVSPVSYAGALDRIEVYESVTFKVTYDECGVEDMAFRPIPSRSDASATLEAAGVLDPMGIQQASVQARAAAAVNIPIPRGDYFIIVPETLEDAVADLALWKRQKGYNVTVKTIESILADPRYAVNPSKAINDVHYLVDEAASLRGYLIENCTDPDNTFCLLVGNSKTSMPIRKVWRNQVNGENYSKEYESLTDGELYSPTETYFEDLVSVWNLYLRDGIYTLYTADPGYSPSISVGRLLCSKPSEINNYFQKLSLYETNPGYGDVEYLDNALFFEDDNGLKHNSNNIRNELSFIPNITLLRDDKDSNPGLMGSQVITALARQGFSSWHGHGNPGSVETHNSDGVRWYISALDKYGPAECYITEEDKNGLDNINNKYYPQIAYSVGCDTTPFDDLINKDPKYYRLPYNMGESFTVGGEYGGPAFLGNYRVGFIITSELLERYFIRTIKETPIIGKAESLSKSRLGSSWQSCHVRMTHSLIGDPEFEMWRGKPDVLDLTLNIGSAIEITGSQLTGAKLSISDGMGNVYYASSIPSRFSINKSTFSSSFNFNGYAISVWKTGMLPMIRFIGGSGFVIRLSKSFIVRDALIGSAAPNGSTFTIGTNGNLKIRAIDEIKAGDGFVISNTGNANLNCERNIKLGSTVIKKGGNLEARGETVTLEAGFTVEAGGTLYVSGN